MRRTLKMSQLGAIALVLSLTGTALAGQKHAGYMRTMEDLRIARALLQRTNEAQPLKGSQDEVSLTIVNIEGAMAEIDKEVGPFGGKTRDLAPIDPRMSWGDRLSKSLKFLEKAEQDCSTEKDNSVDGGLRTRVWQIIDHAHNRLTVAMETKNFEYNARNMPTRND